MKLFGGKLPSNPRHVEGKQKNSPKPEGLSYSNVPSEDWERDWDSIFSQTHAQTRVLEQKDKASGRPASASGGPKPKEAKKKRKVWKRCFYFLSVLGVLYWVAVFSPIPLVEKWRAIYIETAMGTMTHQWLATAFIPRPVIDRVMEKRGQLEANQNGLMSQWELQNLPGADFIAPWEDVKEHFFRIYPEIDPASFEAYAKAYGTELLDGQNRLVIDKAGLEDGGTDILTTRGDKVLAIDTVNGITIALIQTESYVGRLAIVKDPARVGLGLAENFGTVGATIGDIVKTNGAVLGMNASGFYDPDGHGNGGSAYGLVLSQGKVYNPMVGKNDKVIAFDKKNKLNIGKFSSISGFRDGVEFKPALVVNGEKVVSGSSGWGIQPRSAIGQTKDGQVLFLVVDGRDPLYSIGCTVGDLADIMADYGAYQACNLDGGSSSILYYNGREISKPSAADKQRGRRLPDGFLVYGAE